MKRFLLLGIAVFVVVAGWTIAWYWAAGEIRKGATVLAEADGVANPKLTCDQLDVAGFPFRFDVTCTGATLISGDVVANVAGIEASVLVYKPTHVLGSTKGPMTLADAFTGSSSRLDWSGMQFSASLEGWRIGRVSLTASALSWTDTLLGDQLLGKADTVDVQLIDIPEQHQPEQGTAALAGYVRVDRVAAPSLAVEDGDFSLQAELNALPDDVRNFTDPMVVQRWRELGGMLNIFELKGEDGADFINGSGRLALDESAQLEGEVTIASRGVVETLEPMFQPGIAPLVFGSAAADGTYSQTLTISKGVIYSGMLVIGAVPPLM